MDVIYGEFSVKSLQETMKFTTKLLMKMVAIVLAVVFDFRIAFVRFENLSVITTKIGCLILFLDKGPRLLTEKISNGPVGGNVRSLYCLFFAQLFFQRG